MGKRTAKGILNIRQKINEKLKLFLHSDLLIYCADDPDVNGAINTFKNNVRPTDNFQLFSWSKNLNATLQITSIEKNDKYTVLKANDHRAPDTDRSLTITIPFIDDAAIENAINCWCVLLYLQVDDGLISKKMLQQIGRAHV